MDGRIKWAYHTRPWRKVSSDNLSYKFLVNNSHLPEALWICSRSFSGFCLFLKLFPLFTETLQNVGRPSMIHFLTFNYCSLSHLPGKGDFRKAF